ncbi:iron(III) transport system substrate-binding protein [Arcanobacterium wilhelmae]|uniref:Iron(III) transport system substrate-binding protein n=1 Tax=Arcanobacterium wilhelmae TaxID=1803177 RepID=A0ABT9N9A6_9ACTO|nr:ABC transporter substrate-binding protein [Arcanobacterium wilhelmae]MDP9800284.1 iron(III) transport system substrate-binding protein [Arcanobacterium wilhelmae]WFN89721.1 ABC transporter substrate-binding protein [Arcanobacterium wilhelmae]
MSVLKKSLGALGALTLGMSTLAACAVDDSKQASGSGSLTVACGAMDQLCQTWTSNFQKKTGIPTKFVRLSSGETVARLTATKGNPEFDIWHGGPADGFGAASSAGLLENYVSPEASKIDAKYKNADGSWTGVYIGILGFCSNQKMLEKLGVEQPTSWDDLLNPKLKSQVESAHPSTSGTAYTTLWSQRVRLGSDDAAIDYMKKLSGNILQYTKSGTAPGQAAGRGEIAVGISFLHDCALYKEQGMKDIILSTPKEGTGYEVGGVGIIKGTKNLDLAKKYVDWAISAEAQNLGPEAGSYQAHTNPEAKDDPRILKLDNVKLLDWNFDEAGAKRAELTKRFDNEVVAPPSK